MAPFCPTCRHRPSMRSSPGRYKCPCGCHALADRSPELFHACARLVAEAVNGHVLDVTARKAAALLAELNTADVDPLLKLTEPK